MLTFSLMKCQWILKQIKAGEESNIAKFLSWLEQNTQMTWVSLSTSGLLDYTPDGDGTSVTLSSLFDHLNQRCPSYMTRRLGLTMRSAGNISEAAHPDHFSGYRSSTRTQVSVLPPATRSTVPGPRPICLLTRWGYNATPLRNCPAIQRSLKHVLTKVISAKGHIAILCDYDISPREVAKNIAPVAFVLYDAGIDTYDVDGYPTLLPEEERKDQRSDLEQWLCGSGGILITHSTLFNGMESPVVVVITQEPGGGTGGRSSFLRAVAALIVITDSNRVKKDQIQKRFDAIQI